MAEEVGFDVLVHGRFDANDMVEYFGPKLVRIYLFSKNGWYNHTVSMG